jgi:hypothetical protein
MLLVALRSLLEICARLVSKGLEYSTLMLVTYKKPPMKPRSRSATISRYNSSNLSKEATPRFIVYVSFNLNNILICVVIR